MQKTELLLKRITFQRKRLKLEEILRLIYFDKTDFNFDKDLLPIINYLRKFSKYIIDIGYDYSNKHHIYVKFCFNLDILSLEEINSIGQ